MKWKLLYIVAVLCCTYSNIWAQSNSTDTLPSIVKKMVNQVDGQGRRMGPWFIAHPERMGEEAMTEFGTYDQDHKTGLWYKMDSEGDLLAIETYRNNVLDGEVKYFDKGLLTCVGHYRTPNPAFPTDTIMVVDPTTGFELTKVISSDVGTLRHGMWRFYDGASGRMIREEEYQVDQLIYKKEFLLSHEDSVYYQKKIMELPHNTNKPAYAPPAKKQYKYTQY